METWLQSSDLSAREFGADLSTVIAALQDHDWLAEETLEHQRSDAGQVSCPAGLGLVREDGRILHICPNASGALVHFHHPSRALGFLWRVQRIRSNLNVPHGRLVELIELFFEHRDTQIKAIV